MRYLYLVLPILLGCSRTAERPNVVVEDYIRRVTPEKTVAFAGWGTIRGKVTFDGEIPENRLLGMDGHVHAEHCHAGELREETWKIDARTRGVANVIVWLHPPKTLGFPRQPPERKTWKDTVVLDQPACTFGPHVFVLYPEYYDAESKEWNRTGQQFIARNSSKIRHTVDIEGSNTINPANSIVMDIARDDGKIPEKEFSIRADRQELSVRCRYHKWMTAYFRAFDHPYAAVTAADGSFEIRNAPAGAEVEVRAWHEAGSFDRDKARLDRFPTKLIADGVVEQNFTLRKQN